MDKCKHRYSLSSHSCDVLIFRCRKCGESASRKTSKEERKKIIKDGREFLKSVKGSIHWIYHQFRDRFMEKDGRTFKCFGYDLMVKVRRWVKKHPSIQIVSTDCRAFMGAMLVLIPHESKYQYFGTTAIFIDQDSSRAPTEFFLYPYHTADLVKALHKIQTWEKKKRPKQPKSFAETLQFNTGK